MEAEDYGEVGYREAERRRREGRGKRRRERDEEGEGEGWPKIVSDQLQTRYMRLPPAAWVGGNPNRTPGTKRTAAAAAAAVTADRLSNNQKGYFGPQPPPPLRPLPFDEWGRGKGRNSVAYLG